MAPTTMADLPVGRDLAKKLHDVRLNKIMNKTAHIVPSPWNSLHGLLGAMAPGLGTRDIPVESSRMSGSNEAVRMLYIVVTLQAT